MGVPIDDICDLQIPPPGPTVRSEVRVQLTITDDVS
jgi:hypothetical protein